MNLRDRQREATRALLLEAAARLVAERGAEAATTRDLARAAGVAAGTVFAHFPDKASLYEALLHEHIERALDGALATLPAGFVDQLAHVAEALWAAYDSRPDLSRVLIAQTLFLSDPERPLAKQLARFQGWFVERLAAGLAAGEVPPIDPQLAFATFFSSYLGLLLSGLRGELPPEARASLFHAFLVQFFRTRE
ncbi:TetR/AcrR family transcriptional regulator [Vulgatibacter incomptus]|uniref:Transcriptional regulator, TetR family n=1 Tax=Vulgatibacter incomptus TaxID=1391653 RepID=A0A0K1PGR5_9BACT|nr:TetR/AcrR family transcriptional regulator [Vulgatibacter incomptus]AKU92621.1 Transcriptional regulator, TetR family [Vulgatibacter incomptus]